MKSNLLCSAFTHLRWLCLITLLAAACQRTPLQLEPGTTAPTPRAASSAVAERSAVVQEVSGTVEVRADGNRPWAAAKVGDHLDKLAQVRTGADSRALLELTEGSKIRLAPNTAFSFTVLNAYLDSLLTSLQMTQGKVWVLLNGGALDVETPLGVAQARAAYLSAEYDADRQTLAVTCLQGTCSLGDKFIPGGTKFVKTRTESTGPVAMSLVDYGEWGVNVPEATQLAWLATEAVAQGSATLPVVATATASLTPRPSPSVAPRPTDTPVAGQTLPAATPKSASATPPPSPAAPSPTTAEMLPSDTPVPFTPIPRAPLIGHHVVLNGETLFCIARAYGVLPAAIAEANDLYPPFTLVAGQELGIPAIQWTGIAPGPVCPPQFTSPYPGLSVNTPTPTAGGPLTLALTVQCTANCDTLAADYHLHIEPHVAGGVPPYTYNPGIGLDSYLNSQPFGHCSDVHGLVTVKSADGQTAATAWSYHDSACPTPTPKP